jgi:hypothetical protein
VTHHLDRFKSIKEYADAAKAGLARARKNGWTPSGDSSDSYSGKDWYGATRSFDEAYEAAVKGWDSGHILVTAHMDRVMPRVRENIDPAPVLVPEHYGELYDIGEYMAGNPEYAWDVLYDDNQAQARVLSVLVANSLICYVDPEDVLFRGSLVLACMEAMEALGHQMEVWVETTVAGGNAWDDSKQHLHSSLVRARAAGEQVDMKSIAFICDPGWHRRIGFCYQENFDDAMRDTFGIGSWYGYPKGPRCEKIVGANATFDLGTDKGWPKRSATTAEHVQWVMDTLDGLESHIKVGRELPTE